MKQLIQYSFCNDQSGGKTFVSNAQSQTLKSIISRAGDLSKNNDRLKFALCSIRFPQVYDEENAKQGHPTPFLKVLHYTLFGVSGPVKNYIFSTGVDPDTVHLNDQKFMKTVVHVLANLFHYKPKITLDQFFRYGFAESKMLLCTDVITQVKRKHRELRIKRSLSAKRSQDPHKRTELTAQAGRYSVVDHNSGMQSSFYYERDTNSKIAHVASLDRQLVHNANTSRSSRRQRLSEHESNRPRSVRQMSLEGSQRLFGSLAFQPSNRHSKRAAELRAQVEEEAKTAKRSTSVEAGNILRYRGDNKVDMKEFETSYQAEQTGTSLRFRETAPVRRTQDFESAKVIEATEAPPVEFKRTAEFSSGAIESRKVDQTTEEAPTEQKENQNQDLVREEQRDEQVQQETGDQFAALMSVLESLSTKFNYLETQMMGKIDNIEQNYSQLNTKIEAAMVQQSEN